MNSVSRISIQTKLRQLKEPFRTSLRTVTNFEVIEFKIETDDGFIAYGEAVETPAITGDTLEMILVDLNGPIKEFLSGSTFSSARELCAGIAELSVVSSTKAAADVALFNLSAVMENLSLPAFLGCRAQSIATDVTIPISELADLSAIIQNRIAEGFHSYKVKLAMESIELSVQKLQLIDHMVGDLSSIRVDPNQAWTVGHTLDFLKRVESAGLIIEYLEQPTPAKDKTALAQIRRNTDVPIMADESCFTMQDLHELIELDAVDFVNLKLLKSGGISPTLEMAEIAKEAGVKALVGSMMEGDRGVYAAAALAATIAPDAVHDLDASWWATDSQIKYANGEVSLT
ncbi:MAG TPA: enolase C-terminal domain-like protein [Candidatus Paceibacterota bacterium]|nr:enolase C-terminal domain-like protein [Candidatus Paceibacterota bacterium]